MVCAILYNPDLAEYRISVVYESERAWVVLLKMDFACYCHQRGFLKILYVSQDTGDQDIPPCLPRYVDTAYLILYEKNECKRKDIVPQSLGH